MRLPLFKCQGLLTNRSVKLNENILGEDQEGEWRCHSCSNSVTSKQVKIEMSKLVIDEVDLVMSMVKATEGMVELVMISFYPGHL